jgi:uncharacterized protein involved in exopolysaccharide biosynthesis
MRSMAKNSSGMDVLDDRPGLPTARDVAAIFFRRKRLIGIIFVLGAIPAIVWALTSTKYQAEMKILVRRERLDPMITPQHDAPAEVDRDQVSEEDLNSEVELLKSSDLLNKAVVASNLQGREHVYFVDRDSAEQVKIAKAVEHLSKRLNARPVQKTNLISVSYDALSARAATQVLENIEKLYVEKHLEVHRPAGQVRFFDQETEHYRSGLAEAEQKLSEFSRMSGVASAQIERDLALQKLSEVERAEAQDRAEIGETERRIGILEAEQQATAARVPTQEKNADNPQLMEVMKSTLLTLHLKRSELAANYDLSYRPIQELDRQIAQTSKAIDAELKAPMREESTDRNEVYEWIVSEIAKSRADLAGLKAKESADLATLAAYRQSTQKLQQDGIVQSDLLRDVKVQEESYLLYHEKREEARISEALDERGIINVAIAQPPSAPPLPKHPAWLLCMAGLMGVGIISMGAGLAADVLDPSFKTPDEASLILEAPVLAALPRQRRRA